jgi:dATP pyrophosphohydrolase
MTSKRSKVLVFPFFRENTGQVKYAIFNKVDTFLGRQGGYWQSIAGGVEEGETLTDAARREAREEGGIDASNLLPLDSRSSYVVGDTIIDQSAFAIELPTREIRLSEEHSEYRWVTLEEALSLLKFPDYKVALRELDAKLSAQTPARKAEGAGG